MQLAAVPVCCGWYGADDDGVGEGVEVEVEVEVEVVEVDVVGVAVVSNEELVVGGGDETVPTTQ